MYIVKCDRNYSNPIDVGQTSGNRFVNVNLKQSGFNIFVEWLEKIVKVYSYTGHPSII